MDITYPQDIVINSDVFERINSSLLDINFKSYKENLKLKRLVTSEDLLDVIKQIFNASTGLQKKAIEEILRVFEDESKFVHLKNGDHKNYYSKNQKINTLINLGLFSNSQLINSEDKSLSLVLPNLKNNINLELLSIEEMINPPSFSKLFTLERDIDLKKNDKFNIYETLEFYWLNTQNLCIEDDYLRHKKRQFPLLIKLLKTCANLKNVKIFTPFLDKQQDNDEYYNQNEFVEEIIKSTNITPIIVSKKVGERHYITDLFDIHLGKGLDFFTIPDFKVYRPKVSIRIKNISHSL